MSTDSGSAHACVPGSTLEEMLGAVFSGFALPVIVKDAQLRFVYVNAAACALLGRTARDLLGRTDEAVVPAAQAQRIMAVDREILASGEPHIYEETITTANGECRQLLTHKYRIALPGVGPKLVIAVTTDVTQLRQAERRQRRSEEHYRALVDLLPQVVWLADASGAVIEIGPTWGRLSGRAPEAAYGSGWEAAVHPEDLPRVHHQWHTSVASGAPLDVQCRVLTADGSFRWVRNRAAARRDEQGRIVTWHGLLEDVHESKSAEEALRESEGRFRLIADNVPVIIWLADAHGATTYLNRSWQETTGQTAQQALGRGWLEAVHREDRAALLASIAQARAARGRIQAEYRLRRVDGSWAWVIDIGQPRLSAEGELLGYTGCVLDLSERKAAELALEQSEALVRSIVDSTPDCIQLLDADGEPLFVNPAGRKLFGLPEAEDVRGYRWGGALGAGDFAKGGQALEQVRAGQVARFEAWVTTCARQSVCMDIIAAPVLGSDGKPARMLTIWRDISGAKAARDASEAAWRAAESAAAKLALVLENTLDCVVVIDREWHLTYLNANARRLLSLGDDAIGQSLWTLYPQERNGVFAECYRRAFATNQPVTFEEYLPVLDRWLEVHASPTDEGLSIFFRDTSERRRAEHERFQAQAQVFHMSRHDALTNLPNRLLLRERLERNLSELHVGAPLAVLTLDLDAFKQVNDTYGHPVGDMLLRQMADRLTACVRDEDTVARVGGDEFVVVAPRVRCEADAELLATRIIEALQRPFDLEAVSVDIGASVGIAFAPDAGTSVDALLRASDVALYRAKAEGRGTFRRYVPGMDAQLLTRQAMKAALKGAIARNELELFFQPLVDLLSQKVSTCEALLRWRRGDAGLVSPAEFIPVAEECGLIHSIGEWVLRRACHEAVSWGEGIAVAVNLSPFQFKDVNLVSTVADALARSGLAAARLQLEITESVMLDESDANLRTLQALRRLGVKIVMDDFGTGYSSFGYLRRFPFDKIKVDQSFVGDLPEGRESLAVVRAVAGIGRSLGITTAVEGVETQAQLDAVSAEGFDEVQGYLFSNPVPAAEVGALLRRLVRQ
ncbi:diguanylate cyclase [Pandoraea sputorum]|nr:diguanylate cyclase [Pandoraea sputorum]